MCKTVQNQCNCGYATHPARECICTPLQVRHYLSRVSGPLLDRIDLHVDVPAVKHRELAGTYQSLGVNCLLVTGDHPQNDGAFARGDGSAAGNTTATMSVPR